MALWPLKAEGLLDADPEPCSLAWWATAAGGAGWGVMDQAYWHGLGTGLGLDQQRPSQVWGRPPAQWCRPWWRTDLGGQRKVLSKTCPGSRPGADS
jgi:hypothetical protein